MTDRSQHFAAHPYYLMGVADERNRILALIHERLNEHDSVAEKIPFTGDEIKGFLRGINLEAHIILNRVGE